MSELLELAARCEAAPGQNRLLDFVIATATGWECNETSFSMVAWRAPNEVSFQRATENWPPEFTKSIDAALTLLPPGWFFGGFEQNKPSVRVWTEGNIAYYSPDLKYNRPASPALALCAAALRALDSLAAVGTVSPATTQDS